MIQAVIFDKSKYTIPEAIAYLRHHKLKPIKQPHTTEHYIRFRINIPHFDNYITASRFGRQRPSKDAKEDGIKYVIGY